ncbi:MAG: serine hydrolase, partial [Pseudomonadota bacterium]
TDVLAWIAERVTGRSYAEMLADIADAMGVEGAFHVTCDRRGLPWASGGGCLSARDLARLGLLFVRGGAGANGAGVGDPAFIERTRAQPTKRMPVPIDFTRYSNQMFTDGAWVGHGGYGGQFMLANLETGIVAVFFSVLECDAGYDRDYSAEMIGMLAGVAAG